MIIIHINLWFEPFGYPKQCLGEWSSLYVCNIHFRCRFQVDEKVHRLAKLLDTLEDFAFSYRD